MELRRAFDRIPEQFDRWRPRYCGALFRALIEDAGIGPDSDVLELGPGTGQATTPLLDTGCRYLGIELGEHLAAFMRRKYGDRDNFRLVNDDFITHDFGAARFDLVYSAMTIQWIPEDIAFPKCLKLLKPGGTLAMLLTRSEYRTPNEALYRRIQAVYAAHFKPEIPYRQVFHYDRAEEYGFEGFLTREFPGRRVFDAGQYVAFCQTHCDHMDIPEPDRTAFFTGLREAVEAFGNRIVFNDTYVLMTARKPAR